MLNEYKWHPLYLLRVLVGQYQLDVSDLPEIGFKSMVSRVLSGERQLNRNHMQALSTRFDVCPTLFFNEFPLACKL